MTNDLPEVQLGITITDDEVKEMGHVAEGITEDELIPIETIVCPPGKYIINGEERGVNHIFKLDLTTRAPEWRPIETAPLGVEVLVYGGAWEGEVNGAEPYETPIKAMTTNRVDWPVSDTDGYAAWVNNPTDWAPLPPPPKEKR